MFTSLGIYLLRQIYCFFLYLGLPLIVLRLFWRSLKTPEFGQRWLERFGFFEPVTHEGRVIWVHAVSVGETLAAVPMIRQLQLRYPDSLLVVTTMTPTGYEQVEKCFGSSVRHIYAPYDFPGSVKRFIKRVRPSMLLIMETELWPNMIHYTAIQGAKVILTNARLSARSAKGYQRVRALIAPMLKEVLIVAAQYEGDAQRLMALGVPKDRVFITGNIKFDIEPSDTLREQAVALHKQWCWDESCERFIWLAASTHKGEDEIILDAFQMLCRTRRDLLLVLVPRHPERFQDVKELCLRRRLHLVTRSSKEPVRSDTQVVLGDTMGELMAFCGTSDVAFMGGSFVPTGGHNPIEPAAWGVPILMGPHVFNFSVVTERLQKGGGLTLVDSAETLAAELNELMGSSQLRSERGLAAHQVAKENQGALERLLQVIDQNI